MGLIFSVVEEGVKRESGGGGHKRGGKRGRRMVGGWGWRVEGPGPVII